MRKLTEWLLRHRTATVVVFALLTAGSLLLYPLVQVNYDLSEYLPQDSMTKRAMEEMEESFGYDAVLRVMVEDVTLSESLDIKETLSQMEGVASVLWLDDVADIRQPLETLDAGTVEQYYRDGAALYQVTLTGGDYDTASGDTIDAIRALGIDGLSVAGNAEEARNTRILLDSEMLQIFAVVVPFCLLILFLASKSWVEPLLYLAVLFVAIFINLGTNVCFSSVSFITQAMAAVLQLAISLDYSLFLFHRYLEERDAGKDAREAVLAAVQGSLNSILASALTTIAGFLAMVLMQYSIGRDIGFVLAKGITLSFLSVILLMPVLIYLLRNVIDKTRHKPWMPSFAKLGRGAMKIRWVLVVVLVVLIVPAYLGQQQNVYLYGDSAGSATAQTQTSQEREAIEAKFGVYNPVVLLVPRGDTAGEIALAQELEAQPAVTSVQALVTLADPTLPRDMLPDAVVEQFESDEYSRMIVQLNIAEEGTALTQAVEDIEAAAEAYYPGQWLAVGTPTSLNDIRLSVESDGTLVQILSILAVGIIVMLAFRSIVIPVLLVALIQCAIWINMSVPYFTGEPLIYIGYLVISGLQLGATIDYAILLTNRYRDERRLGQAPMDAAVSALKVSGHSILVSTLILAGAGFSLSIISNIPSVSIIGLLLCRGALLSGGMVIVMLPPLLALLDRVIRAGTIKRKGEIL
ncbi:MAG TPA: MMPL family transporter [Candidatus Avichristensenella intestinipullorum]|uniref:MMPL family transporter n=1 Tax=Candidatus Avichristensenella intestinipullorum TaxID=2840693 RepID=A0A9D1CID7_9FIRM|nr:MMPL family transporter [Candidatus Avichristensenella intestinipullorum]